VGSVRANRHDPKEVVMPGTDARAVAARALQAWTTGDLETTRSLLHDDVTFVGPLATVEGADDSVEGLRGLAATVKGAEQHRVIADGDDVVIIYDLITTTPAGTVPTAGWYRVRDGRIAAIRAYFDARPFTSVAAPQPSPGD
jgi:ketosteroid isomerase-like protein